MIFTHICIDLDKLERTPLMFFSYIAFIEHCKGLWMAVRGGLLLGAFMYTQCVRICTDKDIM